MIKCTHNRMNAEAVAQSVPPRGRRGSGRFERFKRFKVVAQKLSMMGMPRRWQRLSENAYKKKNHTCHRAPVNVDGGVKMGRAKHPSLLLHPDTLTLSASILSTSSGSRSWPPHFSRVLLSNNVSKPHCCHSRRPLFSPRSGSSTSARTQSPAAPRAAI
jgi:hypothetical protein